VWQQWYTQFETGVEVVAIAEDNQPREAILRWVNEAKATYRVLHDRNNVLYEQFRPDVTSTLILDEKGRLARPWKYADLLEPEFHNELDKWAKTGVLPPPWLEQELNEISSESSMEQKEAFARIRLATVLADRGKRAEAIELLRTALELDPDNYVLQNQLGALERPSDYYEGDMPAINFES